MPGQQVQLYGVTLLCRLRGAGLGHTGQPRSKKRAGRAITPSPLEGVPQGLPPEEN
jgi:hypothetical protein